MLSLSLFLLWVVLWFSPIAAGILAARYLKRRKEERRSIEAARERINRAAADYMLYRYYRAKTLDKK